jgi:hypothetical protein
MEAKFRCVNCGNKVEKNLMPWRHAINGIIPSINSESSCCENPSYEDGQGFHDAESRNSLRQGASRALSGVKSLSFSDTKSQMNGIKMSVQRKGMIGMEKAIVLISILMMVGLVSGASSDVPKATQTPGDTFYFLDKFSESLELTVAKAPVIGGPELEAKVRANHAAERLAEARKLANQNESERVNSLMAEYSKQKNLSVNSAREANNTNLSQRLGNVSDNHVEVLQDIQNKVPEQAQKGIQNAIENSQKNRKELNLPEKAQKRVNVPENIPDQANRAEKSGKGEISDNKSDRTMKSPSNFSGESFRNETSEIEGNISERNSDNINKNSDRQNQEENINNTEDPESRITGEAVGNRQKPDLP